MFTVGTQNLDVVYSHYRAESSIMAIGIAQRLAHIVHLLGVQQPLQDGLVSLEDGAVFVQVRDADLIADILEGHKILRKMSTEVLQLITIIVDEPTIFYLHRCGTLHHLTRKRLRDLRPRTIRRFGVCHLDVALRAGIVLQHHHVVLVAPLH